MTEQEWAECKDPWAMMNFLRGKASDRKLRLFAVGYHRALTGNSTDELTNALWEVAERFADGRAEAAEVHKHWGVRSSWPEHPLEWAWGLAVQTDTPLGRSPLSYPEAAQLLQEVFGPIKARHFNLDPAVLDWNDGVVLSLARTIYEDRAFDRLGILADALEDAGCTDSEILTHLRGPGPHVRGCWAVDLLLGKE